MKALYGISRTYNGINTHNVLFLMLFVSYFTVFFSFSPSFAQDIAPNEQSNYIFPTVNIPDGTSPASNLKIDKYFRAGGQASFSRSVSSISDIEFCNDSGVTCSNLVSDTATMSLTCAGDPAARGGWNHGGSPSFSGQCWQSLDVCVDNPPGPPICFDGTSLGDPSLARNHRFNGVSNCSPSSQKSMCAYENDGSDLFYKNTGDHMFGLDHDASAFLDYRGIGADVDLPGRLRWVARNGGDTSKALMVPSGPPGSFADYINFLNNSPSFVTVDKGCFPIEANLCMGEGAPCDPSDPSSPCAARCKNYSDAGGYSSQPATDTASGCEAGTFADISDTGSEWQWTCTSSLGADANCSAEKGNVVCGPAAYNGQAYNGETYGSYDELEADACLPGYTIFKGDPGFCFTIADTGSTPYSSGGINSYECIANSEEYTSDCAGKTSGECTFFTDADPASCGPANGNSYADADALNAAGDLCDGLRTLAYDSSNNQINSVSGAGPWNWTCRMARSSTFAENEGVACSASTGPSEDGSCRFQRTQNQWSAEHNAYVATVQQSWCDSGTVKGSINDTLSEVPGYFTCEGINGGTSMECALGGPGQM
ncbi:MAG: hypothetical protein CL565_06915 [Alphaproteobacteria bacterium]|nr:hypothetical protein [Alphaproteobacteria bacterium]